LANVVHSHETIIHYFASQ